MNRLLLVVFATLLVACGTNTNKRVPVERLVQERFAQRPPAYRAGYVDGCKTGIAEAKKAGSGETRDLTRFKSDQDYASGWYDGVEGCKYQHDAASPEDLRHDETKAVRIEGGW